MNRRNPLIRSGLVALVISLLALPAFAGQLDVHLNRAASHANAKSAKKLARTGQVRLNSKGGVLYVSAFIQTKAKGKTVAALAKLGVKVRAILPNGTVTADVPVNKLRAVGAMTDVGRVEAARKIKLYNDKSNGMVDSGAGQTWGMNNTRAFTGNGVIVAVIDSGLDWTHPDFIDDATGKSRILYYWDQSDLDDDKLPAGAGWSFSYGHEYTKAEFDAALGGWSHVWDKVNNTFSPIDDPTYPIKAAARDTNGHGTHVTGTAAGDGSGSGYKGVAPDADIIFVKFDFDGDRNSDAAIVDGIDYIFKRSTELGKPCVINMSLGSDFGPHDGSTLEETGIDALTGAGKVVVVAAGNPGSNNWSEKLSWGFAMHGSGTMSADPIVFRFPAYDTSATDSYVFFDLFYPGSDKCRVRITTPSGAVYPSNFSGKNRRTWTTGSSYTGFDTTEGGILVGNGGDQLSWGTTSDTNEIYIEISNYWGTAPATGEWKIELIPMETPGGGGYHSWHSMSNNVVKGFRAETAPRSPTPTFGGRQSDNAYTIGSPASADKVIAVAAYQTRNSWSNVYGSNTLCSETPGTQSYGVAPIDYYDAFALGELAYFSGRGPRRDGVLKPEIAAPGVGITSSLSRFVRNAEWPNRCTGYFDGGPYHFGTNRVDPSLEATTIQGTSMACPNATGAVALLLSLDPTLDDNGLRSVFAASARHDSQTDVASHVPNTAQTDTDMSAGTGIANNDWGFGKLDLAMSIAFMGPCTADTQCDDGNACTTDVCSSGSCSNTAVSDDTACGAGGLCCSGTCSVPTCTDNAGCGDSETCTADTCVFANTCAAVCTNEWPSCGTADGCCGSGCTAANDPDCSVCSSKGATCSTGSDCCSGKCGGKPSNRTCK
ncbi:MAG: S8 family serine peptidase [Myxococcales bacterium]|nr:S8 family serine peptidase [Myxococcales bacterium]